FAAVRRAWMERAGPIGEAISVTSIDGPIRGTYRGLADNGALLAEVGGELREINHGDVALGGADTPNGDA
ncbi:MAG: biotin--[acetyl-CoA-carboxylase] ligase, partial [Hyphomicrobium denitrificans]|nr:biotin--[acetyl-CoA-carboxylase] ligase [Hyphomicrobium denitrificans]